MSDQTGRGLLGFIKAAQLRAAKYRVGRSLAIVALVSCVPASLPGVTGLASATSSGAAPAVVGQATTFSSSGSATPQTSIPNGVVSGDVLVSLINTINSVATYFGSYSNSVTCPTGWTKAFSGTNGSNSQLVACTYVVGSSTPVAEAKLALSSEVAMVTEAFSGINTTNPIDAVGATAGLTPPSVTTTEAGDLLVLGEGSTTSNAQPSAPSGATLLTALTNGSLSQTAVATEIAISAGATSKATWSASTSTAVTGVIALRPSTTSAPADPPQAITFTSTPPANPTVGGTYSVTAAGGGSGSPVTFSIDSSSTSGACSISGATVSFTGTGTCVIDANQAAGGSYNVAAQVQQSFTIAAPADPPQTITFTSTPPTNATVGGTYSVSATGGGSGSPVTFSIDASSTSGACSISGATVSFKGVGTCVIDANQAAGGSNSAAAQVQQSFTVVAAAPDPPQAITFTSTPPTNTTVGGTYSVSATGGGSGNSVSFSIDSSSTSGACSISGATVSFTGAGTCVIDANQAGNATYSAAPQAQQSLTITTPPPPTTPIPSCAQAVSSTEMLSNPGFESPFSTIAGSWGDIVWGGASVTNTRVTTNPHSGTAAQGVNVTTLGTGGVIFEQRVTLTAGTVYQGSVWLRSPNAVTVDFYLRSTGAPDNAGAEEQVTLTSNWQQFTIRGGFAATTPTYFGINFDSIGTVVVDDASLRVLNSNCVASTAPIPATYLGMDINKWGTYTVWPSELNFGLLRLWNTGTTWADLEPQSGVWDWTRLDYYVQTAVKNHEAIMLTLGQTPQWASSAPDDAQDGANASPTNISAWDAYVQAVATRYKGEIKYWEIWDEADVTGTYDGTPQEMVTLTQAAYQVLKAVDPSNVVVSPSFTTNGLVFMRQFLNDGGGKYIDVMSVHLYPGLTPEDDLPNFVADENLMQLAGIGNDPLWDTEGASGEPTSTDQAAGGLVARTYLLLWAWGISNFDWYCWDNAVGSPLSQTGYITPTAAGIAYEQVAGWLDGASMLNISQASNGTWTITLQASDGSLEYAVWNVNGSTSFAIPAGWTVGSADDLAGGSTPVSGGTVTIGIEPLLLVP